MKTLRVTVKIQELNSADVARTVQLLNKTNQMNLTTRRLNVSELTAWVSQPFCKLWTLRIADKFGDYGLTGIVSVERQESSCRIVDFILSCRVFGRKVEEAMMYTVYAYAKELGVETLEARYLPTPKNKPCLDFLVRSGLQQIDSLFCWDMGQTYPQPEIAIEYLSHETIKPAITIIENTYR